MEAVTRQRDHLLLSNFLAERSRSSKAYFLYSLQC